MRASSSGGHIGAADDGSSLISKKRQLWRAGFLPTAYGDDPQLWIPLNWDPVEKHSFVLWRYFIYARLKNGVTLDAFRYDYAEGYHAASTPNTMGIRRKQRLPEPRISGA